MLEPKNRFLLPLIGLLLPLIFYFFLASFIAPYFSQANLSNDILLATVGIVYLMLISWSNIEANSQSKFFQKLHLKETAPPIDTGDEDAEKHNNQRTSRRKGTCFFINVLANLIAVSIYIFFDPSAFSSSIEVQNIWYQFVILLVSMLLVSNIFRIITSSVTFNIEQPHLTGPG